MGEDMLAKFRTELCEVFGEIRSAHDKSVVSGQW